MALSDQEAARIGKAAEKAGFCYMPGYSLRFFAARKRAQGLLAAGAVGEIQAITAGMGTGPLAGWLTRADRAMAGECSRSWAPSLNR